MDQNQVVNKNGKSDQLGSGQTRSGPVDFQTRTTPGSDLPRTTSGTEQPTGPSLFKEQEKTVEIESRSKEIVEGEEIPELGPEFREIEVPEKLVPRLPSEVVKAGVTPVLPPTLPWDITPPAQTVTLPITKKKSKAALSLPVVASLRWLAEWCLRLMKITRGRVRYVFKGSNNYDT
jgi:hypothetical protein